jgi:hypothetical protein
MTKFLVSAVALITVLAVTDAAFAAGVSKYAPGHLNKQHHVSGTPGASHYAPGHMYLSKGSVRGHPGASGYAPGRHAH